MLQKVQPYFNQDWWNLVSPLLSEKFLKEVASLYQKRTVPKASDLWRVFKVTNYNNLKVVIIGQDPYPGAGDADSLAFSSQALTRPKSLANIFWEVRTDYFKNSLVPMQKTFFGNDLTQWAEQGVLLLNRSLTTIQGKSNQHHEVWNGFTTKVVMSLNNYPKPLIYLLWGTKAKEMKKVIDTNKHVILTASHPSPKNVKGFEGCRHFTKANKLLAKQGIGNQINWGVWQERVPHVTIKVERLEGVLKVKFPKIYIQLMDKIIEGGFKSLNGSNICDHPMESYYLRMKTKPVYKSYNYLKPKQIAEVFYQLAVIDHGIMTFS